MPLESINPATGKVMQVFGEWSAAETDRVIEKVYDSWPAWRERSFAELAGFGIREFVNIQTVWVG
jgi:acyl-CoA reductase-like NAD-dependent aldehyde dehydrogenase